MLQKITWSIFIRNLSEKELTGEKIFDFTRLTIVQGFVILSFFFPDVFIFLAFPFHVKIAETLLFGILGVHVFWDVLRNYATRKRIILFNFILITGVLITGLVAANPFRPIEINQTNRLLPAGIQLISSVGTIESRWGQVFIVSIVERLLMK